MPIRGWVGYMRFCRYRACSGTSRGARRPRCRREARPSGGGTCDSATHDHRLQGAGRPGWRFVAYGLGNLAFYADAGPATSSGILTVTVTGRDVEQYRWTPARLVGQVPRPLTGAAAEQASSAWGDLRTCTDLQP